jgi:hypothetical protein
MNKEWVAANQEYMKFQKMNPIFGMQTLILSAYSVVIT